MFINIRLTKEEKHIAKQYAKSLGLPLNKAMKTIFFEKIEDEYDCAIADQALREYKNNPQTISHEDIKKKLDI